MNRPIEPLAVGWHPGAVACAGGCAAVLFASALAIHLAGVLVGIGLLVLGVAVALACWHEATLEGPALRLRGAGTLGRETVAHARSVDRLEYRRGWLLPRLSLHRRGDGMVLRATGPDPRADAFRQAAMWLLVHGRRRARIDPALLDALAAMPDHAQAGQPHDASHA